MKYNNVFVDAYWHSRKRSFLGHLFDLMTSWAVVCDVYYIDPQTKRKGESAEAFANCVKAVICERASLTNTDWNGYLKYFKPSKRFIQAKQKAFADGLQHTFRSRSRRGSDSEPSSPSDDVIDPMARTDSPVILHT